MYCRGTARPQPRKLPPPLTSCHRAHSSSGCPGAPAPPGCVSMSSEGQGQPQQGGSFPPQQQQQGQGRPRLQSGCCHRLAEACPRPLGRLVSGAVT